MSASSTPARETRIVTIALVAVVFVVLTVAVIQQCRGHLTYTLDDSYIHLALSKHLRHLAYGLNAGEAASPASSILWPFLLAPFAGTAVHEYIPLLLNFAATIALALLVLRLLSEVTDGGALTKPIPTALGVLGVLVFTNVYTVGFSGLEHVVHALTVAAVAVGLVIVRRGGAPPWWLWAGIVVGPSIRYEGILVTALAVVILFVWGHRRLAVITAGLGALPVLAFSAWLVSRDLPLLPSSVLAKSNGIDALTTAAMRFADIPLLPFFVAVLIGDMLVGGRRRVTALHGFALAVLLVQATNSDWGSLSRYLLYTTFVALPVVAHLYSDRVAAMYASARTGAHVSAVALVLAVAGFAFAHFAFLTPRAAENIYLQQAQMGRFVQDFWRGPVAVNDLGEVAFQSDHYVLDLWGLGNETARKQRLRGAPIEWMDDLARAHDVDLAMIYRFDRWFPKVPQNWTAVGQLRLSVPVVTASHDRVTFYATTVDAVAPLRAALTRFKATLPEGATFVFV